MLGKYGMSAFYYIAIGGKNSANCLITKYHHTAYLNVQKTLGSIY